MKQEELRTIFVEKYLMKLLENETEKTEVEILHAFSELFDCESPIPDLPMPTQEEMEAEAIKRKYENHPDWEITYRDGWVDSCNWLCEYLRSKALAVKPENNGWISVTDRLPVADKPEKIKIVAVMDAHNQKDTGYYDKGKWHTESPLANNGIKFWFELPES